MADESEMRLRAALVSPMCRDDARDRNAEDDPCDVHRSIRSEATVREYCIRIGRHVPNVTAASRGSCHAGDHVRTKWRSRAISQGSNAQIEPSSAHSGADAWAAEACGRASIHARGSPQHARRRWSRANRRLKLGRRRLSTRSRRQPRERRARSCAAPNSQSKSLHCAWRYCIRGQP